MRSKLAGLALLLGLAAGAPGVACRPAGEAAGNAALARFPPARFDAGLGSGGGVYAAGNAYRIYLDVDSLRRSRETQVTPDTLSLLVSVGGPGSRYGEDAPSVAASDGTPIRLGPDRGTGVVAASRRLPDDVEILYLVHASRVPELAAIDRRVLAVLRP